MASVDNELLLSAAVEAAPDGGTEEAAGQLGRTLAGELFDQLQPVPPVDAVDPVEDMLRAAERTLARHGVQLRVLRTKTACAVVRVRPADPSRKDSCALSKGFLAAIPQLIYGREASLIETTCVTHAADACLFTMLWEPSPPNQAAPEEASSLAGRPGEDDESIESAFLEDHLVTELAGAPPGEQLDAGTAPPQEPQTEDEDSHGELFDEVRFADSAEAPLLETVPVAQDPHPSPAASRPRAAARRPRGPAWLRRRGWLLAALTLAGLAGGYAAASRTRPHYVATVILEVRSGASSTGPGGANDAGALAITYAALIPNDSFVLHRVAAAVHGDVSTVGKSLQATVEAGTSLLAVHYSAPTSASALAGANAVAVALTAGGRGQAAIGSGSLALVSLPAQAGLAQGLRKLGVPFGALAGLVLGAVAVAVGERADRRIDKADDLSAAAGCPASELSGGLDTAELARAASLAAASYEGSLTVVALTERAEAATAQLATDLRSSWLRNELEPRRIEAVPAFGGSAAALAEGRGPTILAVAYGERVVATSEMARRLVAIGRKPVWAVIVPSEKRHVGRRAR